MFIQIAILIFLPCFVLILQQQDFVPKIKRVNSGANYKDAKLAWNLFEHYVNAYRVP